MGNFERGIQDKVQQARPFNPQPKWAEMNDLLDQEQAVGGYMQGLKSQLKRSSSALLYLFILFVFTGSAYKMGQWSQSNQGLNEQVSNHTQISQVQRHLALLSLNTEGVLKSETSSIVQNSISELGSSNKSVVTKEAKPSPEISAYTSTFIANENLLTYHTDNNESRSLVIPTIKKVLQKPTIKSVSNEAIDQSKNIVDKQALTQHSDLAKKILLQQQTEELTVNHDLPLEVAKLNSLLPPKGPAKKWALGLNRQWTFVPGLVNQYHEASMLKTSGMNVNLSRYLTPSIELGLSIGSRDVQFFKKESRGSSLIVLNSTDKLLNVNYYFLSSFSQGRIKPYVSAALGYSSNGVFQGQFYKEEGYRDVNLTKSDFTEGLDYSDSQYTTNYDITSLSRHLNIGTGVGMQAVLFNNVRLATGLGYHFHPDSSEPYSRLYLDQLPFHKGYFRYNIGLDYLFGFRHGAKPIK